MHKLKCNKTSSIYLNEITCIIFPTCIHLHFFKLNLSGQGFPLSGTLYKTRTVYMIQMSLDSYFAPVYAKRYLPTIKDNRIRLPSRPIFFKCFTNEFFSNEGTFLNWIHDAGFFFPHSGTSIIFTSSLNSVCVVLRKLHSPLFLSWQ